MKHAIRMRWLANPNEGHSHFRSEFLEFVWICESLSNWRFSCSLYGRIGPPIRLCLIVEFRVVIKLWALIRAALYTAWGWSKHRPDSCLLSPQSGPILWTFFGPDLVLCRVMRPNSRARWSWGFLCLMKLIMVNARCSRQLSFMTLTMGDDLYGVVVSESKLHPARLDWGLWIYSGVKIFYELIYHVQWINRWVRFRRHTKFLINGLNVHFCLKCIISTLIVVIFLPYLYSFLPY